MKKIQIPFNDAFATCVCIKKMVSILNSELSRKRDEVSIKYLTGQIEKYSSLEKNIREQMVGILIPSGKKLSKKEELNLINI